MLKSLLCGALSLALVSTQQVTHIEARAPYAHPYVEQVLCLTDGLAGTAFRITPDLYLSVNHVTKHQGCTIGGLPITVKYADPVGDFSIVQAPLRVEGGIPISCKGYTNGEYYYAIGFADGLPWSQAVTIHADWLATLLYGDKLQNVFKGIETVIPGMSGGPVLNAQGQVVGVINAYNGYGMSWSRALRDTVICEGK